MENSKNATQQLLDRLEEASNGERSILEYYKRAYHEARNEQARHQLKGMMGRHQTHIERLHSRQDALSHQLGHGFISQALASIGDAISDVIAGLPVEFIEDETDPTPEMLQRREEDLIAEYMKLQEIADEETTMLLNAFIDDCRAHLETLLSIDPMSPR